MSVSWWSGRGRPAASIVRGADQTTERREPVHCRSARSLTDAEAREDPPEQVVARHLAGDLAELSLRIGEFLRDELARMPLGEQAVRFLDVRAGTAQCLEVAGPAKVRLCRPGGSRRNPSGAYAAGRGPPPSPRSSAPAARRQAPCGARRRRGRSCSRPRCAAHRSAALRDPARWPPSLPGRRHPPRTARDPLARARAGPDGCPPLPLVRRLAQARGVEHVHG